MDITDEEHLESTVERAMAQRNVRVTERNPISSRSHAWFKLSFSSSGGALCFVDLAGSERNYETTQMTAAMHHESANINKALMALKDCFRVFYEQVTQCPITKRPVPKTLHNRCSEIDDDADRSKLVALYTEVDPEKLSGIDGMLERRSTARKRQNMWEQLRSKYPSFFDQNGSSNAAHEEETDAVIDSVPDQPRLIRVPFRASKLTQMLRQCFTDIEHLTTIITCEFSPAYISCEVSVRCRCISDPH